MAKRLSSADTPQPGPASPISNSRATSTSLLLGCDPSLLYSSSCIHRNTISAPRGCGSPIVPMISLMHFFLVIDSILSVLLLAAHPPGRKGLF